MKVVIEAEPKEFAALVVALQERQEEKTDTADDTLADAVLGQVINRQTGSDRNFR